MTRKQPQSIRAVTSQWIDKIGKALHKQFKAHNRGLGLRLTFVCISDIMYIQNVWVDCVLNWYNWFYVGTPRVSIDSILYCLTGQWGHHTTSAITDFTGKTNTPKQWTQRKPFWRNTIAEDERTYNKNKSFLKKRK